MSRTHSHTYCWQTTHHKGKKIKYNRARDKREINDESKVFKPIRPSDNKRVYRDGSYSCQLGYHNAGLNGYIASLFVKFCNKKYSEFKRIALMKAKMFGISNSRLERKIYYTIAQNAAFHPSSFKNLQFFRRGEDGAILLRMFADYPLNNEVIRVPLFYGKDGKSYAGKQFDSYFIDKGGFIRKQVFIFQQVFYDPREDCGPNDFDESWEISL